jgi:hypothetical protein
VEAAGAVSRLVVSAISFKSEFQTTWNASLIILWKK